MEKENKKKTVVKYVVSDGVQVTSKRGQLVSGTEVFPKDFPTGQKRVDELIALKALVKK